MKMPEKHDLLAAILAAKEQGIGAIPCVCNGVPSRQIYRRCLQNSNRRNDVRHYRLVYRDLLDFAGLSSNLAYITSVFIGYIGTDLIGSLIAPLLKKPE